MYFALPFFWVSLNDLLGSQWYNLDRNVAQQAIWLHQVSNVPPGSLSRIYRGWEMLGLAEDDGNATYS